MSEKRQSYDVVVKRDDFRESAVHDAPDEAAVELSDGQALLRINNFSLTANNVTYAAMGELMGYWKFFPAKAGDEWGTVPVWGYADVVRSEHDEVEVGTHVYGYFPMSTHLVVEPGNVSRTGFVDSAAHRADLPAIYNRYGRASADDDQQKKREPYVALFGPLFTTSFMINDWLVDENFSGARRLLLSSASSKTALGLAFLLQRDHSEDLEVVGLTSPGNVDFVRATAKLYEEVVAYDDIETMDTSKPTAYLDFAGNAELVRKIHQHFGDQMVASVRIGVTDWEELVPDPVGGPLPGPQPSFFFAPTQIAKRNAEWGASELRHRITLDQDAFIESTKRWLRISTGEGPDAIREVFTDFLDGRADPAEGWSLTP